MESAIDDSLECKEPCDPTAVFEPTRDEVLRVYFDGRLPRLSKLRLGGGKARDSRGGTLADCNSSTGESLTSTFPKLSVSDPFDGDDDVPIAVPKTWRTV